MLTQSFQAPLRPPFTHVAIVVTDIHQALDWYKKVLGIEVLSGPIEVSPTNEHSKELFYDVFGESWKGLWLAQTVLSDGTGIEFFQFAQSERPTQRAYWKTGTMHLGVNVPDVAAFARFIEQNGGRQRSKIWETAPGCSLCMCEDPFGTWIELYNGSYADFFANRSNSFITQG